MEKFVVRGGRRLSGEVDVHGAKNSALPLLAATILCGSQSVLHNCPSLSDVDAACMILDYLGCGISREENSVVVDTSNLEHFEVPDTLMREMRSSIVFLGAIIARLGRCRLCFPGGCELGPRPIDLHLSALRQMGIDIREEHGYLDCSVSARGIQGTKIVLSFPSVGATENIMLAAVLAKGDTVIVNAAREPEIIDLAQYLNKCGARILGAGGGTIVIHGVRNLHGCEHTVIPDRIVTVTYLCMAAITGGEIIVNRCIPSHFDAVTPVLEQMGCRMNVYPDSIYLNASRRLRGVKTIRTLPYPGFPTDAQALIMAVSTVAEGTSVFVENIFESRYKHIGELARMGADIKVEGKVAIVDGVEKLYGADVEATDLRGGASLLIAGLGAEGITRVTNIGHIDRGYDGLEKTLREIGADIQREKEGLNGSCSS